MQSTPPTESVKKYVRTDVSITTGFFLIFGLISGFFIDWSIFALAITITYMTIGAASITEWNSQLLEDGEAPRDIYFTIRAVAFVPSMLVAALLLFQNLQPFFVVTPSIAVMVGYLHLLKYLAFKNISQENVYFKPDPYTREQKVFLEEVYVPRLEKWSIEQPADE